MAPVDQALRVRITSMVCSAQRNKGGAGSRRLAAGDIRGAEYAVGVIPSQGHKPGGERTLQVARLFHFRSLHSGNFDTTMNSKVPNSVVTNDQV